MPTALRICGGGTSPRPATCWPKALASRSSTCSAERTALGWSGGRAESADRPQHLAGVVAQHVSLLLGSQERQVLDELSGEGKALGVREVGTAHHDVGPDLVEDRLQVVFPVGHHAEVTLEDLARTFAELTAD